MKESGQDLELSPDLLRFMEGMEREEGPQPVTMLNLLSFLPDGKPKYYQYGQAFVEVAGRRGGDAKIVGNVVKPSEEPTDSRGKAGRREGGWWNEISLVHYPRYVPSIFFFSPPPLPCFSSPCHALSAQGKI